MNLPGNTLASGCSLLLGLSLIAPFASKAVAQTYGPFGPQATPAGQRVALHYVRSQVENLRRATRTASKATSGGLELVWEQFVNVRGAYVALKHTLTAQQGTSGANELAELDAGLDIIQEAFTDAQQEIAGGRSSGAALSSLCRILDQSVAIWVEDLGKASIRLKVGWG